jgi:hypothetical protein
MLPPETVPPMLSKPLPARVDQITAASLPSPVNAMVTVTGAANVIPAGPNTKTGDSATQPSGGGFEDVVMLKSTLPLTAPAGTVSVTPSASTVPPAAPIGWLAAGGVVLVPL